MYSAAKILAQVEPIENKPCRYLLRLLLNLWPMRHRFLLWLVSQIALTKDKLLSKYTDGGFFVQK
jgi:hypothetical protein